MLLENIGSTIDLHTYTTVPLNSFPIYDESIAPCAISNSRIPHIRNIQEIGSFVVKEEVIPQHNVVLEAFAALVINHIANASSYYYTPNAIELNGKCYSMSLVPEIPFKLDGNKITYAKLQGQQAGQEAWEKMVDWEVISMRSDPKLLLEDLETQSRLLKLVDSFHEMFLNDIKRYGIELLDHDIGRKQLILKIDEGLSHIFIGVVDFEQRTDDTDKKLTKCISEATTFQEFIELFLSQSFKCSISK